MKGLGGKKIEVQKESCQWKEVLKKKINTGIIQVWTYDLFFETDHRLYIAPWFSTARCRLAFRNYTGIALFLQRAGSPWSAVSAWILNHWP